MDAVWIARTVTAHEIAAAHLTEASMIRLALVISGSRLEVIVRGQPKDDGGDPARTTVDTAINCKVFVEDDASTPYEEVQRQKGRRC